MASRGQNIKPYFDVLGWSPILSVKELQYAHLTRAIYVAAKFKANCSVSVTLKGVTFKLTPEIICKLFHLDNKGVNLYGDNWFDHYKLDRDDVFASFLKDGSDEKPTAANLTSLCDLFQNITVRTIVSRAGSWDKVNNSDLIVVYHLLKKKPLNLGRLGFAIGPKHKRKKTATHKISKSVKKKGKVGEPLAEVEAEEELPEHETDLFESGSETPEPSEEIEYSTPEPEPENVQEGFNSMFIDSASVIPFNLNPYQYYSTTGGFHPDDEMQGIFQGQTSNTFPSTSFISPTKSSNNPLMEVACNFIASPILDPKLNKPSSSSPLPEPSQFGSLGSFGDTNSENTNAPVAAPAGPTNADVILNIVGLQQTVASYGNRQALMNNWMLGEFLPAVAPNLATPFLPEIAYPILPVSVAPTAAPATKPSDQAPPPP
ncbi:hypothetical protein MTR_4g040530 [Medicago truncatula]|uniref:Uncharacterized protein n=1 Tax=Medicago truncatula TaxID=3880 RepID=A0A072UID5_MEDTR|nr:hypothetical protein MTR_4g040530 [Medicago truncatula]